MSAGSEVLRMRLDRTPDPVAAYAALCAYGTRAGSALLESAAPGHGGTQRSVLALAPALRVALVGEHVVVDACSANGRAALAALGGAGARHVLPAPRSQPGVRDEAARLREPSVFDALRTILRRLAPTRVADRARLLLVGALSFELAARFEPDHGPSADDADDYVFTLPELLLDIDHAGGRAELCAVAFDTRARNDLARAMDETASLLDALPRVDDPPLAPRARRAEADLDDRAFAVRVRAARTAVRAGDVYQLVLSRRWTVPCAAPFAAYRRLRRDNPSPYLFYLRDTHTTLFGASPESAVRYDAASRALDVYPVAGTRPRGVDADADARIEVELRHDEKELSEHMMLVDLARNDVARVCVAGTRSVPVMLGVDRYRHVMHLVSRVRGTLRPELDALHALRACLNVGTLCGAPKSRAHELIRGLETARRGHYGGAVGLLDAAGNLDTAITIRAATVAGGIASVQAGAGIVLGSVPQAEADETRTKARAVLDAIAEGAA